MPVLHGMLSSAAFLLVSVRPPFLVEVDALTLQGLSPSGEGAGLGMMWGRQRALAMLAHAGFHVEVLELAFDSFNDCYLCHLA